MEKIIGHRGASAYAPENTFAAFDRAFALGCRMIEFDVMLSVDGEPFVIHDDNLKRTTNGRGWVHETSAEALRQLDAGKSFSRAFSGERIPHLADVLNWLLFTQMQANIELKSTSKAVEATVVAVLSLLNQEWPGDRPWPLISSFDLEALRFARSLSPEMPLGLLLGDWRKDWLTIASELECFSIHLNQKFATRERIQAMKEENYKVAIYTVNSANQAKRLFGWGVDAVFSDYPDLMKSVM